MRTYVYCSYKFSPVGFRVGVITYDSTQKDFYIPTKKKYDYLNFVIKAFEEDFVSKMYGLIPESKKYIFLVKKLQKNNVDDPNEGTIDFYMNFAFEFDNFNDYNNFCGNFRALANPSAECANFIITDRYVENFALKIDANVFNKFIEKMLKNSNGNQDEKKFFVETNSPQTEEYQLQKTFGIEFSKDNETFIYPAKKKLYLIPIAGIVTAIVLAIIWYLT